MRTENGPGTWDTQPLLRLLPCLAISHHIDMAPPGQRQMRNCEEKARHQNLCKPKRTLENWPSSTQMGYMVQCTPHLQTFQTNLWIQNLTSWTEMADSPYKSKLRWRAMISAPNIGSVALSATGTSTSFIWSTKQFCPLKVVLKVWPPDHQY